MKEIWKDIPGYEGLYQISNLGKVYSKKRNKLLVIVKNDKGYCYVQLYKNGKSNLFRLHRIVAKTFIPNPKNLPEVNHLDGNKENNCVNNLEWCTHIDNMRHGFKNNLIPIKKPNEPASVCKKVYQYDLNNNLLNIFKSVRDASRLTGINFQNISRYCLKQRKCKNYIWKYADE